MEGTEVEEAKVKGTKLEETKLLRREFDFQIFECDALKEYLEEMAEFGWILIGCSRILLFEKQEPKKLSYRIEIGKTTKKSKQVKQKQSELERVEQEQSKLEQSKQEEPIQVELVPEFIGKNGKIHIYRFPESKETENIPKQEEIQLINQKKDRENQIKTLKYETYRQNRIKWMLFPIFLIAIILIDKNKFPGIFASGFDVTLLLLYLFLILPTALQFGWFQKWNHWLKREKPSSVFFGKKEWEIQRRRSRWMHRGILFFLTILMMWYLGKEHYFVMFYIIIFMTVIIYGMIMAPINKSGAGKYSFFQSIQIYGILQIVVIVLLGMTGFYGLDKNTLIQNHSLFEVAENVNYAPLTYEDFIYTTTKNTLNSTAITNGSFENIYSDEGNYLELDISRTKSILAWESEYIQGSIRYKIFESPYSIIRNAYEKAKSKGYSEVNGENWKAQKAYFWSSETGYYFYVVEYPDYILCFQCDWELTESDMAVIVEQL